ARSASQDTFDTDFGALNSDSPSLGTEIGKFSPSHATGEPDLGNRKSACLFFWVAVVPEGIDCSSSNWGTTIQTRGSDFNNIRVSLMCLSSSIFGGTTKKKMDKESSSVVRSSNNINGGGGEGSLVLRASSDGTRHTTTSDLVLQWGNRKRLRCMKVQVKDKDKDDSSAPVQRTTVRVDRRVVRTDKDSLNKPPLGLSNNNITLANNNNHNHHQTNGYPNLRQRPSSPQQRILRNSETSSAMRGGGGGQSNGGVRGIASPDRGAHDKRGTHNNINNNHHHHHHNDNNKSAASSDTAHDSKKGGSPSGSGDAGTKLPQRPKKRAKFIQRTLNLVSPGAWLSDLTLERYEVREKKISKKRPRGLKAMNNVESDSE
ncbi:hypothetical protein PIB30_064651, partial [Stylosanthes scabra]|nr:hypothetical protein [Stylosanthes scabra]